MKKILKNTKKTKEYLDKLSKIYLIGYWARYGIMEYPFSGKYDNSRRTKNYIVPLVYDYDDHNGTTDSYYLRRIDDTTSGEVLCWTQNKAAAQKIVKALNEKEQNITY